MREVDPVWLVYPTILPELVKRETDDLGNATIRLVPAFYTLFLPTQILLGAGQDGKNGRAGGGGLGTCWEIRIIPGARSMGFVLGWTGAAYLR